MANYNDTPSDVGQGNAGYDSSGGYASAYSYETFNESQESVNVGETSRNNGHDHLWATDENGNGVTDEAVNKQGERHSHEIRNFVVLLSEHHQHNHFLMGDYDEVNRTPPKPNEAWLRSNLGCPDGWEHWYPPQIDGRGGYWTCGKYLEEDPLSPGYLEVDLHKPLDSYYYVQDNTPLANLVKNDSVLQRKITEVREGLDLNISKRDKFDELKPFIRQTQPGKIFCHPGNFIARINAVRDLRFTHKKYRGLMEKIKADDSDHTTIDLTTPTNPNNIVNEVGSTQLVFFDGKRYDYFTNSETGGLTSVSAVEEDYVTVESFDYEDYPNNDPATVRVDLLYMYANPAWMESGQDSAYSDMFGNFGSHNPGPTARLGLIKGAFFRDDIGGSRIKGDVTYGIKGETDKVSIPSPEDAYNYSYKPGVIPDLREWSLTMAHQQTRRPDGDGHNRSLFILPIAYIFVNPGYLEGDPLEAEENFVDIRPFFRSTELTGEERHGLSIVENPGLENRLLTRYDHDYVDLRDNWVRRSPADFRNKPGGHEGRIDHLENCLIGNGYYVPQGWENPWMSMNGIVQGGYFKWSGLDGYNGDVIGKQQLFRMTTDPARSHWGEAASEEYATMGIFHLRVTVPATRWVDTIDGEGGVHQYEDKKFYGRLLAPKVLLNLERLGVPKGFFQNVMVVFNPLNWDNSGRDYTTGEGWYGSSNTKSIKSGCWHLECDIWGRGLHEPPKYKDGLDEDGHEFRYWGTDYDPSFSLYMSSRWSTGYSVHPGGDFEAPNFDAICYRLGSYWGNSNRVEIYDMHIYTITKKTGML